MAPTMPIHYCKSKDLSRDQQIRARALFEYGAKYIEIAQQLGITIQQVQTAVTAQRDTPRKRSSRPPLLSEQQLQQILSFMQSSKAGRQASWETLAIIFDHFRVSAAIIRYSFQKRGYQRYVACAKSPLSKKNKRIRL